MKESAQGGEMALEKSGKILLFGSLCLALATPYVAHANLQNEIQHGSAGILTEGEEMDQAYMKWQAGVNAGDTSVWIHDQYDSGNGMDISSQIREANRRLSMPVLSEFEKNGRKTTERRLRGVKIKYLEDNRTDEERMEDLLGKGPEFHYNSWEQLFKEFQPYHDMVTNLVFQTIKVRILWDTSIWKKSSDLCRIPP